MPKPGDLLRSLGQENLYYWHGRASQSIHSSRIGFSARFRPGSDAESPILIPLESPIDEVARVGAMAVQAFSLAMIAAADVLGWESRAELVEYRERVVRLSVDLFAAIAGKAPPGAGAGRDPKGEGAGIVALECQRQEARLRFLSALTSSLRVARQEGRAVALRSVR